MAPKVAQKRGERRPDTDTHHIAIVTTSSPWNGAFYSPFSSVLFKRNKTVHKAWFYSGPPSVLYSPAVRCPKKFSYFPPLWAKTRVLPYCKASHFLE
jgi:hypothetical protein